MLLTNLKKHRMLAGLTQEELADAVGIHRVTVVNLEGRKYHVGPHTLAKLADTLGVETRDLVGEPNGPSEPL
jgi:DNA-binding XRE family transcriptional regulator